MTDLVHALASFVAAYHARPALIAEQKGWSRTVGLIADDSGEAVELRIHDGVVVAMGPQAPLAADADVVIRGEAATLRDILELRRGPNEPYLFGELTVRGAEADFLRIDYIASTLCPS